jgi:hypothetical protein
MVIGRCAPLSSLHELQIEGKVTNLCVKTPNRKHANSIVGAMWSRLVPAALVGESRGGEIRIKYQQLWLGSDRWKCDAS